MEIYLTRTFQKEVRALSPLFRVRVLAIIDRVIAAETLADVPNLTTMEGVHNFYRIRMGLLMLYFWFIVYERFATHPLIVLEHFLKY